MSWRKGHRYLTLVSDHCRRQVVWGTNGAGADAADRFFADLDPDPPPEPLPTEPAEIQQEPPQRPDPEPERGDSEQRVGERASKLTAISMDMGPGCAKSAREHAPSSNHLR